MELKEIKTNATGVKVKDSENINEKYAKVIGKSFLPPSQKEYTNIPIKDIPFMISSDGAVVCIPRLPEMGVISVIGLTGSGKTLVAGLILDNMFWTWGDYIGIINDSQEETFSWSEPCSYPEFKAKHRAINQTAYPLPMVYLFPKSSEFYMNNLALKDKNSVCISIPFEDIINNLPKYIPDIGEASSQYLNEKKNELLDCQTNDELMEVINSINVGTSGMKEVVHKLKTRFKNLIEHGILNLEDRGIPSYLTAYSADLKTEYYKGNPFTAVMMCECIPSFVTSDLYVQRYKDAIFSYYLESIFQENLRGAMKGKRVWLYFDELTKVIHANPRYSNPETELALANVASRGRNNGISLIYATQNYNEIPKSIRSQTKFGIIFRHKDKDQTTMLKGDFAFDKLEQDMILNLKKYEALAVTTEYFVCYKGNKVWQESKPILGTIIPALHNNRFLHKKM